MKAPSHAAFALLWGGIWASTSVHRDVAFGLNALTIQIIAATVVGALMPDLDSKKAPIAKALWFLSVPICRRYAHRTLMHSLLGLGLASAGVCALLWLPVVFGLWASGEHVWLITQFFAWGYLSHLILDTANKRGVPYLYGLMGESLGFPSHEDDRIISGDRRWEIIITVASVVLFVRLIPVIQQGAATAMANVVGKVPQLREVYRDAVGKEVTLEFEGYWEADRRPVSGKGLILEEQDGVFTLYYDGRVHDIGEDTGDLRLQSGKVAALNQAPVAWPVPVAAKTIADMLAEVFAGRPAMHAGGPVLLSGRLLADRSFAVNRPYDEAVFAVTAKALEMSYASVADIATLGVRSADSRPPVSELEQKLAQIRSLEDSLVSVKKRTHDLYPSQLLFEEINELRNEMKALEKGLESRAESRDSDAVVRFSGHVSARLVPVL